MNTTDLTTQTPGEIDTALGEIWQRYYTAQADVARYEKYVREYEDGLAKKADGAMGYYGWTEERLEEIREDLSVREATAAEIRVEMVPFNIEYNSRPWTRFFHVTNSNGHIHSSMGCSTCYPTTRYAWLTEMSGQSEDDALESLGKAGHVLCSVCFPNAPSEYFVKREDPSVCAGSGRYYDPGKGKRTGYYSGNWAHCSVCGTVQTVTKNLVIRKHKIPKAS